MGILLYAPFLRYISQQDLVHLERFSVDLPFPDDNFIIGEE
jgi:hypothetical protein